MGSKSGETNLAYETSTEEILENGTSAPSGRRQSDGNRRTGMFYRTLPEDVKSLQQVIAEEPKKEEQFNLEPVGILKEEQPRLRKISTKADHVNFTAETALERKPSRKGNPDGSSALERKISRKSEHVIFSADEPHYHAQSHDVPTAIRKISEISEISLDEAADGVGSLSRNNSARASKHSRGSGRHRKISAFQKAIETIAHVHVDVLSMKDGSLFEMFVPRKSPQILAAMAATIGAFGMGTVMAWSSSAVPQLEKEHKMGLTPDIISWIAALVPLAGAIAGAPTGQCIDAIGRKPTMLAISIPFTAGWLLIAYAFNYWMILAGRFLTGYCAGAISLTAPVFISETAQDSIRGILGSGFHLMITLGILFSYTVGAFVDWRWLAFASASVPILMCLIMLYVPASPRYLLSRGLVEDAEKALMWFRGATTVDQVREELDIIQKSVEDNNEIKVSLREFFTPTIMKPLMVSIGLMILQSFSGADAIIFYTVSIFREAGSALDERYATIIVGVIQVLATLSSLGFVEKAGRRGLLLTSDLFMALALVALGSYFFLDKETRSTFSLLPLGSLVVFVIAYSFGFGPVPWMMMGEVLPNHIIGTASSIATSVNWSTAFLMIRFFEDIKEEIGTAWCYLGFASWCVAGIVFVFFFVPETKGKSLDEIQQIFASKGSARKAHKKQATRKISRTTVDSYFFA